MSNRALSDRPIIVDARYRVIETLETTAGLDLLKAIWRLRKSIASWLLTTLGLATLLYWAREPLATTTGAIWQFVRHHPFVDLALISLGFIAYGVYDKANRDIQRRRQVFLDRRNRN